MSADARYDVVIVGAGIMGATLAALLHELDPELHLLMLERLNEPALESSAAVNNAGTGHAANCELNYTPEQADGSVATAKALIINAAFERSLELWASLRERGQFGSTDFLHSLPHISAVWGEEDVAFLRRRHKQLSALPAFSLMEWSEDSEELADWMPLVMEGRERSKPMAATRVRRGTDVDFGALTRAYLAPLQATGALELRCDTSLTNLRRRHSTTMADRAWCLELHGPVGMQLVETPFIFLAAGGAALLLLQRSHIPEAAKYAGFPVGGQWLICTDLQLAQEHHAKVYGKPKLGAPPISAPHLDTRWIDGKRSLLFGPYASFSSKFLKQGSLLDLPRSVQAKNLLPILQAGCDNLSLISYLISQLCQDDKDRFETLQEFFPKALQRDWTLAAAGQRVQIIKRTPNGSCLQLGTEVVTTTDGSIAALLGASPGASTAVAIILDVLERCFPEQLASEAWQHRLRQLLPSYGYDLNANAELLLATQQRNDSLLCI